MRNEKGHWQKGVSGNPGGSMREIAPLRRLAISHCPEAIELASKLVKRGLRALENGDEEHDFRPAMQAAQFLCDRGMGRPHQPVELTGADGAPVQTLSLDHLSVEDLERLVKAGGGGG